MFQNFIEVQRQMKNKHMTEEKREKTKKKKSPRKTNTNDCTALFSTEIPQNEEYA